MKLMGSSSDPHSREIPPSPPLQHLLPWLSGTQKAQYWGAGSGVLGLGAGSWVWVLGLGCWAWDAGSGMLGAGSRVLGLGARPGVLGLRCWASSASICRAAVPPTGPLSFYMVFTPRFPVSQG